VSYAKQMLETYPKAITLEADVLVRCIEACFDCSQACTACADDCLSEQALAELVKCIRTCEDCADVCLATGRVISRQTEFDARVARTILGACVQACSSCGDECRVHAEMHAHCKVCAEACHACEQACQELLAAIS
jgi:hypothetical protein